MKLEGKLLNKQYFLKKQAGSGGMAEVYEAWDQLRQSSMAVKVLRPEFVCDQRFLDSFRAEAEHLSQLSHPNIVRLFEFRQEDGVAFLVMEWVDGINLRQKVTNSRTPLSLTETARILKPVCAALYYAHSSYQVFHCDIKPANILLHKDGRVLLSDFGVAKRSSDHFAGGTPPYMAPELFVDGHVDQYTDMYALGVTLYEVLSGGNLPFRGDSPASVGSSSRDRIAWEHKNLSPAPLRSFNPSISPSVERVILKAISKERSNRYSSTLDLLKEFDDACAQPISTYHEPPTMPGGAQPPVLLPPNPLPIGYSPVSKPYPQSNNYSSSSGNVDTRVDPRPLPKSDVQDVPELKPGIKGPYFLGRSGEWLGQMIPVTRKGLIIGRAEDAQLRLREPSVSRLHASILRTAFSLTSTVYIRDENSSAGTYLNGKRLQPNEKIQLHHGDVVQFGQYQVFEFRER